MEVNVTVAAGSRKSGQADRCKGWFQQGEAALPLIPLSPSSLSSTRGNMRIR